MSKSKKKHNQNQSKAKEFQQYHKKSQEELEYEKRLKTKMPGEYVPKVINANGMIYGDLNEYFEHEEKYPPDHREYLTAYYVCDGNEVAHGVFEGQILEMRKGRILFKSLRVGFYTEVCFGEWIEGTEDHIWIYDTKPFLDQKAKVGSCYSFTGVAYAYKRKDGTTDFSLKCIDDVKNIPEYCIPDPKWDALNGLLHDVKELVCETCKFSRHCTGFCLANHAERDEKAKLMLLAGGADKLMEELFYAQPAYLGYFFDSPSDTELDACVSNGVLCFITDPEDLKYGDRVLEVNETPVQSNSDIRQAILDSHKKAGETISVKKDSFGMSPFRTPTHIGGYLITDYFSKTDIQTIQCKLMSGQELARLVIISLPVLDLQTFIESRKKDAASMISPKKK